MNIKQHYEAAESRYENSEVLYERCGRSGVLLPKVSLGFWHNFGGVDPYERSRAITHYAFGRRLVTICGLDLMATGGRGSI